MASVIEKASRKKEEENLDLNQVIQHVAISLAQQSVEKHKTSFMEEFEKGITIEESRKKVYAKIDGLWNK